MTTTMRAERFYADTKKVELEEVPIPEPGPGEVLVKVAFCGICHSDLSLINGTFPAQAPVVTQGHEASGIIAKLGPDVTGWAEGDRVIVAGGLPRVPDTVALEQAAILADAVSTPFGAVVRTGKVAIGESVGVWGVGGVGTHIVQLARLVGAGPGVGMDIQ